MKIKYCDICGKRYAEDVHHTISGTSGRAICDMYDCCKLDLCRPCHDDIHKNNTCAKLSKMYGQAMFERTHTREEFMKLFKVNYLP